MPSNYLNLMCQCWICIHNDILLKKLNIIKMNFKAIAGQLLVVAGGVALYMLAIKPMLDKANVTK